MRNRVLFAALAVVISVGLFGLAWWGRDFSPVLASYMGGLLIPAAAIMIAAFGFGWRRKAVFLAILIITLPLLDAAASATGLLAYIQRAIDPATEPVAFLASLAYASLVYAFPLAMLILFVGPQPSRLWTRD